MEQINIPQSCQVLLDFEAENISSVVRELRPTIFMEDGGYRCVLGPNLQQGIVGNGETPAAALAEWERQLKARIETLSDDDEVAYYAAELLNASNRKVW